MSSARTAITQNPEAVRIQLARNNLMVFTKRMHRGYLDAGHLWLIVYALQAIERGDISRLIIMLPPRHGKSEVASVHFPAWYLGKNPDKRVIACSYASALARRFSRRARNMFSMADWPFDVRPASDMASVDAWDIEGHKGGYIAAGVGGPITGAGADLLIVDDPVKNAEEAYSETYRESTWDWYRSTAYTRLEPDGAVVAIGTRWHQDDLLGRLCIQADTGEEAWVKIELPALSAGSDVIAKVTFPEVVAQRAGFTDGMRFEDIAAPFMALAA